MRVLFITRKYPPSIGGMQRLCYHLITQMKHRVDTSAITWGRSQRLLPFFVPYALGKSICIGMRGIDLAHIGDAVLAPIGWLIKKLFGVPVVVSVHGLDITFPLGVYQWLIPRLLRDLDRLVCNSEATRSVCVARDIPAEKCDVIPPGVTLSSIIPRRDARRWLVQELGQELRRSWVLLTVGRLVPRKGVAWFVDFVLPRVRRAGLEVCYLVVGSGSDERRVRAIVDRRDMEGDVHLLGQVSNDALDRLYAAADLFIMPNLPIPGDMEGFGLVALEAAAHGVPVLASDLEGIRDAVVPGRTGCLLQPGNADIWVKSVQNLLSSPSEMHAIAEQARTTVEKHFTWTRMVDAYEDLFRELLEDSLG